MRARTTGTLVAAALLAGCASFSSDGGFGVVEQAAQQRLGKALRWSRSAAEASSQRRIWMPSAARNSGLISMRRSLPSQVTVTVTLSPSTL